MHRGVGIIIRNESGNLFFVQEKDETYPFVEYRNCCSLFGGKIEDGETLEIGLIRELKEEIEIGNLFQKMNIRFLKSFLMKNNLSEFEFSLFEGILSDDDFILLSQKRIMEGRSKVLDKNGLLGEKWIWGLEVVIRFYLERIYF
jgi:8-oxo-dGTP pyrophosphatase MutT (NUDIX family)